MTCVLAMFAGRTYEDVTAAARWAHPGYRAGAMMPHSLMRRIAHEWGLVLLSSIYMDWRFPGIVGVVSMTSKTSGHALFWDGEHLIDPGGSDHFDLAYVNANAVEFTQRAGDLSALVELEQIRPPATKACHLAELF